MVSLRLILTGASEAATFNKTIGQAVPDNRMVPASFHDVAVPVIAAAIGAAVGSVVTAVFTPLGKLTWEAFCRRRFDPKRAHYNELVEQSKWFETRAAKLATFRQQLQLYPPADRFRLSEMI